MQPGRQYFDFPLIKSSWTTLYTAYIRNLYELLQRGSGLQGR